MRDLNEQIRLLINSVVAGEHHDATYIGTGRVWLVPTDSPEMFYFVAHVEYRKGNKQYEGWVCGCRGFRFGEGHETCRHIKKIRRAGGVATRRENR